MAAGSLARLSPRSSTTARTASPGNRSLGRTAASATAAASLSRASAASARSAAVGSLPPRTSPAAASTITISATRLSPATSSPRRRFPAGDVAGAAAAASPIAEGGRETLAGEGIGPGPAGGASGRYEAAQEAEAAGNSNVPPLWRSIRRGKVKDGGEMREAEGGDETKRRGGD